MSPLLFLWTRWRDLICWTIVICVIAGLFGALHNQVSYTVSADYFHAFKFSQFQIPESFQNRWGAAWVGVMATWWIGLIVGPSLVITSYRVSRQGAAASIMLSGILTTLLATALFSLAGLVIASVWLTPANLQDWWVPPVVQDRIAFLRAGAMHDASYLGGAIGTLLGCWRVAHATSHSPDQPQAVRVPANITLDRTQDATP